MKRAAGQIRKVRRNKSDKESDDGPNNNNRPYANEPVQQVPVRRKPTPEEAALTAKNYRLAKELVRIRNPYCSDHCYASACLLTDCLSFVFTFCGVHNRVICECDTVKNARPYPE